MEAMTPLEEKEIKGISLKLLITAIGTTVTLTIAIMGSYTGLVGHMDKINNTFDLRMKDEEHKREMIELQIKEFRIRLDNLERKVDYKPAESPR